MGSILASREAIFASGHGIDSEVSGLALCSLSKQAQCLQTKPQEADAILNLQGYSDSRENLLLFDTLSYTEILFTL